MRITDADLRDPADRATLVALNKEFAADGNVELPPNHTQLLDTLLATHPTLFAFLARDDEGEPVGYALCHFTITSFGGRQAANIHDLYVAPDARGTGAGRALMEHFEARARSAGCCKITLEIAHDNRPAQRLYQSLDFGDGGVGTDGAATWFWFKMLD